MQLKNGMFRFFVVVDIFECYNCIFADRKKFRPNLMINGYTGRRSDGLGCIVDIKSNDQTDVYFLKIKNASKHLDEESIKRWGLCRLGGEGLEFPLDKSFVEIPDGFKFYIKVKNSQHQKYWYTIYKNKEKRVEIKNGKCWTI